MTGNVGTSFTAARLLNWLWETTVTKNIAPKHDRPFIFFLFPSLLERVGVCMIHFQSFLFPSLLERVGCLRYLSSLFSLPTKPHRWTRKFNRTDHPYKRLVKGSFLEDLPCNSMSAGEDGVICQDCHTI